MFRTENSCYDFFTFVSKTGLVFHRQIEKNFVHKHNSAQVVISEINLLADDQVRDYFKTESVNSVCYGYAIPNLNCSVCFDHPLDHYPLMMMFEIGRQFGVAASHKFYDIPLQGFVNIVDSLSFEFKTFLELDKPVCVVCIDKNIKVKKGIHRRQMELSFIQEGIHCASGAGNISVFNKALYARMRTASRSRVINEVVRDIKTIPTNVNLHVDSIAMAI